MSDFDKLFKRLDLLLDRVETMVPAKSESTTEPGFSAYRWHAYGLEGIAHFDQVDKSGLLHLERRKICCSATQRNSWRGKQPITHYFGAPEVPANHR